MSKKGKYRECGAVVYIFSEYVDKINTQNRADEIFFLLDEVYNPFNVNEIKGANDECYIASGADAYVGLYVDLLLSFDPAVLKK
ncbi:MAG: hypothetical protein LBL71_02280, partial [Endomicrobium sp.]|nr:hypothetical protein [Endomicrobium sp.]